MKVLMREDWSMEIGMETTTEELELILLVMSSGVLAVVSSGQTLKVKRLEMRILQWAILLSGQM